MPICIECRYPVPQLYHASTGPKSTGGGSGSSAAANGTAEQHHAAPAVAVAPPAHEQRHGVHKQQHHPRSQSQPNVQKKHQDRNRGLGGEAARPRGPTSADVRLTQCPRCRRFADKYVEHDFVVLFIDLVLVKPQVYRHLLFNRLGSESDAFDPAITRLGTLLLLFDVYLTWSAIEALEPTRTAPSIVPQLPILAQYAFYLICCALATAAQHLTIRLLARLLVPSYQSPPPTATTPWSSPTPATGPSTSASTTSLLPPGSSSSIHLSTSQHAGTHALPPPPPPAPPGPNAISTALCVSSCMQLFPILMVVWRYDDAGGQLVRAVSWAVGAQNVEALRILLGAPYWVAGGMVAAGAVARWAAKRAVLGVVGLGGAV